MKFFCKQSDEKQAALCHPIVRRCAAFILALSLAGCSWVGNGIDAPEHMKERNPSVQQMPDQQETVRGDKDPPLVKLELGKALRPAHLRPTEELPSRIKIDATNLNNVPVTTALQAILADTDITLLWESEELQNRKVSLMNLKGSLPVVVNRLCRAAKILCGYRNGALELAEEDTFVVQLPGVAAAVGSTGSTGTSAASETIAGSIESLINGKVKADNVGGNLIYTTNAEGHERVQGYLDQLRNGRPLIVMQLYIWQVTLDNNKKLGISWKDLHLPKLSSLHEKMDILSASNSQTVATTEGVSLGAVLSGSVDVNLLAGFLATQGKVQAISSPQLTFVSGTSAKFEVGNSERYVSQVGTLVNSTVAGTGTTSGASNNTVNTEELKTGLEITISGNYESGVVFSNLQIKTSDLIQFTTVPTGTTSLQLPKTANRTVQTVLRVRPGDNLVLAGLQTSREDRNRDGLPGPDSVDGIIPTYADAKVSNSELVLMVKPSVVFFNDRDAGDVHNVSGIRDDSTKDDSNEPVRSTVPDPADKVEPVAEKKGMVVSPQPLGRPSGSQSNNKSNHKSNELQSEFGEVVRTYEDIYAPSSSPARGVPQSILPDNPASSGATRSHAESGGATL